MPTMVNPEVLDKWAYRIYGCSNNEAIEMNGGLPLRRKDTFAWAFRQQQLAQRSRYRVPFAMTFAEWLKVWCESGHLSGRANKTGGGYVMTRVDATGDFVEGNVVIVLKETRTSLWGRVGRALQMAGEAR